VVLGQDAWDHIVERIRARPQMRKHIGRGPHVEHRLAAQPGRGRLRDRGRDAPRMHLEQRDRVLDGDQGSRYALAPV